MRACDLHACAVHAKRRRRMHYASVHQRKERTDGRRLVGIDAGGRPLKKVRDPNWDWVLLKWMFTKSPKMEVFRKAEVKPESSRPNCLTRVEWSYTGWGGEFCDRPFFRDGVSTFVTDPFFGLGWRVL